MFKNIEAERARLGLTKGDLAKRLGVSRQTLATYFSSGVIPSDKLVMMHEIFGVSTDYLLGIAR